MINLFKKRWQALLDTPKHKSYLPKDSDDPVYNLSELVELSKRYGSGFKVIGDHKKFTIKASSAVLIFCTVMISIYLIGFIGLAIYLREPALGVITLGGILIIMLALKVGPLLFYNITVDAYTKTITVKSNNAFLFIGKWIRPGFKIDFNRFNRVSSTRKARKSYTGTGITTVHYVNRIYIEFDQQKRPVIDLRDEINHKVFIICLTRLIKQL